MVFEDPYPIDFAKYEPILKQLKITDPDKQLAVARQLQNAIRSYQHDWSWATMPEAAKWVRDTRQRTRQLVRLLSNVPFPYDEMPELFGIPGDPAVSPTVEGLRKIEKVLTDYVPVPRLRGRRRTDHRNTNVLIREIERITGVPARAGRRQDGAASGPFVRLMRAVFTLAGQQPTAHAIHMAIDAYKDMKKIPRSTDN